MNNFYTFPCLFDLVVWGTLNILKDENQVDSLYYCLNHAQITGKWMIAMNTWTLQPYCGPASFTCAPTRSARLAFIGENLIFGNSESPLILFYFKGKIKQEIKP